MTIWWGHHRYYFLSELWFLFALAGILSLFSFLSSSVQNRGLVNVLYIGKRGRNLVQFGSKYIWGLNCIYPRENLLEYQALGSQYFRIPSTGKYTSEKVKSSEGRPHLQRTSGSLYIPAYRYLFKQCKEIEKNDIKIYFNPPSIFLEPLTIIILAIFQGFLAQKTIPQGHSEGRKINIRH